jgi:alkylhydroperoxidase/carboxymuconolactone decarboxylase family protein YurZ
MFAASKALGNRSLVSRLEVERKFVPSSLLNKYASETSTTPRISLAPANRHSLPLTLSALPRERITDKYFDHKGQFEQKGIWVPWRKTQLTTHDGLEAAPPQIHWEAKVKQGGDYLDSQFVEAKGRDAVETLMAQAGVCDSIYNLDFQLGFVADGVSWVVSGPGSDEGAGDDTTDITLVLDIMSAALEGRNGEHAKFMHHQVGEIELEKTITTTAANPEDVQTIDQSELLAKHCTTSAAQAESMRQQLTMFMAAYPTIFQAGVSPVGKITAYMQRKETLAVSNKKVNAIGRLANMSEVRYEKLSSGK